MMKTDLNEYIFLIPDLASMNSQTKQAWLGYLRHVAEHGDETQFLPAYVYLLRQVATGGLVLPEKDYKKQSGTIIEIISNWLAKRTFSQKTEKLVKYLYSWDEEPKFASAIGVNQQSATSLLNLAILLALSNKHNALLDELRQLLQSRLNLSKGYRIIDLINLIHYLYWACRIFPFSNCHSKVRELLGPRGLKMIVEEFVCPTEWSYLYYPLTGPKRILNHRRWFYGLPLVEYSMIKGYGYENKRKREEIFISICTHWNVPPRNAPGSDFKRDLQEQVELLGRTTLSGIIKENNQNMVYAVTKLILTLEQSEALNRFHMYRAFLRLHYDEYNEDEEETQHGTLILNAQASFKIIESQEFMAIYDLGLGNSWQFMVSLMLKVIHNIANVPYIKLLF